MIIKRRTNPFEPIVKNIVLFQKNMKHTCAYKSLLSIYIIYNYIIYRFVVPCTTIIRIFMFVSISYQYLYQCLYYIGGETTHKEITLASEPQKNSSNISKC